MSKNHPRLVLSFILILPTLAFAADSLEQYIESIKARPPKPIEKIALDVPKPQPLVAVKPRNPFKMKNPPQKTQAIVQGNGFKNDRISLNFQDIQVRAVLQLIADFTGINIVVSEAVKGSITLHLHDVPWEHALQTILTLQGLDKRQVGNVILVDQAAAIAERAHKSLHKQNLVQQFQPLQADLLQINYANAAELANMLSDKTNSLLSQRGTVAVDRRTNTLWLKDTPAQLHMLKSFIKRLDIPVKQVEIEARIVNMNKQCATDMGARFGITHSVYLSGTLEGANQIAQGASPSNAPLPQRLNLDLGAMPIDANPASIGIALAKLGNHALLDMELSALESEGQANVIARPKLVTTNQQAAVIESGEDIPYQEAMPSGATSVSFKKVVLRLKVTPQITPDGKLLMNLVINQDSDSARRVQGVPVILTKSIKTSVLVNNGETVVLGGIYKQDKNNSMVRVPFLGHLPVVGYLFSRKETRIRNEELLIFITPRIMTNNAIITAEK